MSLPDNNLAVMTKVMRDIRLLASTLHLPCTDVYAYEEEPCLCKQVGGGWGW